MKGVVAVAACLLTVAFAGCADADADVPETVTDTECLTDKLCGQQALTDDAGRDLRTDLLANDTLQEPKWNVGDIFEQHMFFGSQDAQGRHIQTMVVDVGSDGYQIATSDAESARDEAFWDFPILGEIGRGLETSLVGSEISFMYDWPLVDGKTWQGSVEGLINWNSYSFTNFELTMEALYDPAIDTPHGDFPGFWIYATTQDGETLMRYNYVPAIGWFSHLWIYDLETDDSEDVMFHAMSMGTSTNYTGDYYWAEEETLVGDFFVANPVFGVVNPGGVPPVYTSPSPVSGDPAPIDFTFDADTYMVGVIVPIAFGGTSKVQLVDPDGGTQDHDLTNSDTNAGGRSFRVDFIHEEAEPGEWQVRFVGAGVVWGGGAILSQVTQYSDTL